MSNEELKGKRGQANSKTPISKGELRRGKRQLYADLKDKMAKIEKSAQRDIDANALDREAVELLSKEDVSNAEKETLLKQLNAVDDKILADSIKASESAGEDYNKALKELHEKAGIGSPKPVAFRTTTEQTDDKKVRRQPLHPTFGYAMFFISSVLGMIVFESQAVAGSMFIIGALLLLPALADYILKKFTWIYPLGLALLGQIIILAAYLKL